MSYSIRKSFLLFIIIGSLSQKGWCQANANPDNFAKMVDFLPPPPNAAAIEKYGSLTINKNIGAPNINISLLSLHKSLRVLFQSHRKI